MMMILKSFLCCSDHSPKFYTKISNCLLISLLFNWSHEPKMLTFPRIFLLLKPHTTKSYWLNPLLFLLFSPSSPSRTIVKALIQAPITYVDHCNFLADSPSLSSFFHNNLPISRSLTISSMSLLTFGGGGALFSLPQM